MARLSASVVMYGGAEEAAACLHSIADNTGEAVDLYLVDNASPGDSLAKARHLTAGIRGLTVAALPKNLGYGGGHNSVLPQLHSRYHVVANPDILLRDDALAAMADWMEEHPDVAITSPRLIFPDGREQHIAKRRPALLPLIARQTGLGCLRRAEAHYLMLDEDLTRPQNIEFCSGSFFMIRTEVYKAIGGFDEGYFMYVEDADITMKALGCGRAVYLPQVTVVHEWQRAAHRRPRQFMWQLGSMLRYFARWGFRWR